MTAAEAYPAALSATALVAPLRCVLLLLLLLLQVKAASVHWFGARLEIKWQIDATDKPAQLKPI